MTNIGLPIICAIGAGLANTIVAVTVKGAERHDCHPSRFCAIAMTIAGVISLIVAWTQPGSWFNYRLWILGMLMGGVILCGHSEYGASQSAWTAFITLGHGKSGACCSHYSLRHIFKRKPAIYRWGKSGGVWGNVVGICAGHLQSG